MVSAHEIRVAAELLQVSPEGLQKSVTFKMTVGLKYDAFKATHTTATHTHTHPMDAMNCVSSMAGK